MWNVPVPRPIFIPTFQLTAGQNLAGAGIVFGTIRSLSALVHCCLHNACEDRKVQAGDSGHRVLPWGLQGTKGFYGKGEREDIETLAGRHGSLLSRILSLLFLSRQTQQSLWVSCN